MRSLAVARDELMKIMADAGPTVLMVTHDVDEAVLLGPCRDDDQRAPATIGEIAPVELPSVTHEPRDRLQMAHHPRYLECRERVLQFLYRKQAHVEPTAEPVN